MVAWGGGTEPGGYLWVYQACGTKEGVAGGSEFLLGRDEVGGGGQKGAKDGPVPVCKSTETCGRF